jgi:hypothetical protein
MIVIKRLSGFVVGIAVGLAAPSVATEVAVVCKPVIKRSVDCSPFAMKLPDINECRQA